MKLLLDLCEEVSIIKEAKEDGTKNYFLEGIMLQGDIKNRNGRIYPTKILEKGVKEYTENFINKRRSFGELGHGPQPGLDFARASHIITEMRQDGNNFIGKAKILTETTMGKIVKAFMDEDCQLGFSSKGLGSLKESREGKIVQSDFILTTAADIVAEPSAPQAWSENIIENADWFFDGVEWRRREEIQDAIKEFKEESRALREEKFLQLWKKILG